jgi:uncharacterized Zn finger protein
MRLCAWLFARWAFLVEGVIALRIEPLHFLADLDLFAAEGFAPRAIEQGQRYYQQGAVSQVAWHQGGLALGEVWVSSRYYASLWVVGEGEKVGFQAACTCSTHGRCRHIVALQRSLHGFASEGRSPPLFLPSDRRIRKLPAAAKRLQQLMTAPPVKPAPSAPVAASAPAVSAAAPKVAPAVNAAAPAAHVAPPPKAAPAQVTPILPEGASARLRRLATQPIERLAAALDTLCVEQPTLERRVFALVGLPWRADDATIQRLARAARDALLRFKVSDTSTVMSRAGREPLIKDLAQRLSDLHSAGGHVEVLTLWSDALPLLNIAADVADLPDPAASFGACTEAVAASLTASGWSVNAQMRWVLNAELSDHHELLSPLSDTFWSQGIAPHHWRAFADDLRHIPPTPDLIEARIDALQNALYPDEALALRRAHLDSPRAYTHLIQLLCEQRDLSAAEAETEAALRKLLKQPSLPMAHLQERMLLIIDAFTAASGDLPDAASTRVGWRWHAFTLRPDASALRLLLADAQQAQCLAPIREAAAAFLLRCELPEPRALQKKPAPTTWPAHITLRPWLSAATLQVLKALPTFKFPLSSVLLDLSLDGDDPDTVYQWLQHARQQGSISPALLCRTAERLVATRPKDAASLWSEVALIAITRGLADHLLTDPIERLRPLLGPHAWTAQVRSLIRQHQHRPRVVHLLNQALMRSR